MTSKIQIIIAVIVLIGLIYIIGLIKKNRLELKYSLPWMAAAVMVLILALAPNIMNRLSYIVGIASPVNMIFFLGFLFSLIIILSLTVAISSASNGVKRLTQQLAILEKKNMELEEKIKSLEEKN